MDKKAIMIRTVEGKCWLNSVDDLGRARSSYLGNVGCAAAVEAWCAGRGIEFRQQRASGGQGSMARRPVASGRNQRSLVACEPACPA
jgi:hypothetical protein